MDPSTRLYAVGCTWVLVIVSYLVRQWVLSSSEALMRAVVIRLVEAPRWDD
jgi:hypothetical protein